MSKYELAEAEFGAINILPLPIMLPGIVKLPFEPKVQVLPLATTRMLPLLFSVGELRLPAVMLPVVLIGFDPNAAKLATTLALPYVDIPLANATLPKINPPEILAVVVMLPVPLIVFDPNADNKVVTLLLPYVAAMPVN